MGPGAGAEEIAVMEINDLESKPLLDKGMVAFFLSLSIAPKFPMV